MDFTGVEALTFDCYGTLIDWESGILQALQPMLSRHAVSRSGDDILELYAALESELESGPYRSYRDILAGVVEGFGKRLGFDPMAAERDAIAESLPGWPPFPDTVGALQSLRQRFKLGIISNIDDDLFAATNLSLGVRFEWITTAQQAHAYKPSLAPFELALQRMGLPKTSIVHVAQSLFHDHTPARKLGLRSVWVNRRQGRAGAGATPASDAQADLEVPTLSALAERTVGS